MTGTADWFVGRGPEAEQLDLAWIGNAELLAARHQRHCVASLLRQMARALQRGCAMSDLFVAIDAAAPSGKTL